MRLTFPDPPPRQSLLTDVCNAIRISETIITGKMQMSSHFDRLVDIMSRLRSEDGCPWDRDQTRESLKPYLIEETYETLEAINSGDESHIKEELGDLLLQIVFHAQLAKESNSFDIHQVCEGICEKLVYRHPHVFGEVNAESPTQALANWERKKKAEKRNSSRRSALDGVPKTMPGLLRAMRLQSKAASAGFDWERTGEVLNKVDEELKELREACKKGDRDHVEEELGDLLFSLVNVSRWLKVNPEEALAKTTRKFTERFGYIEKQAAESGKTLDEMTLPEMEKLWNEGKGRCEQNQD